MYPHPYCILIAISQVAFRNPDAIPERHSILFRYDAPALIIYVRWHETERSFGKLLRDHLYLNYAGNEDSVSGTASVQRCKTPSHAPLADAH